MLRDFLNSFCQNQTEILQRKYGKIMHKCNFYESGQPVIKHRGNPRRQLATAHESGRAVNKLNPVWMLVFVYFVILFIGDLLSGLSIVPQIAPDIVTLGLQLILLYVANEKATRCNYKFVFPGMTPIFSLIAVTIMSAVWNGQGIFQISVFLRAVLGQYILFLGIVNIRFTKVEFKRINSMVFVLCAIQIPASIYRLLTSNAGIFFMGGSRSFGTESASGTLGISSGSMGMTFALVVIGFLFSFYILKHKKIYILWMLGFVFFSFCTGKRAFPIILPPFLFAVYILIYERGKMISGKLLALVFVASLGLVGGMFLHPSLNPSGKVAGDIDFKYVLNKTVTYESSITWDGKSAGRFSSSKRFFEIAIDNGPMAVLFGKGPATLVKSGLIKSNYSKNRNAMGIAYGVTGAGWLFSQIGLLGLLCFLWLVMAFLRQTLRIYSILREPYWRAICGGLIAFHLVIIVDTLSYSQNCVSSKIIPALWFLFLTQTMMFMNYIHPCRFKRR